MMLPAVGATAWGLVVSWRPAVIRAAELFAVDPPPALFPLERWFLLYVQVPVAITAYLFVLVLPGMLAALAWGRPRSVPDLVLRGFLLAFGLRWIIGGLEGQLLSSPRSSASFFWSEGVLFAVLASVLLWRARVGPVTLPAQDGDRRRALWLVALPLLGMIALSPWLLWQDMNGDGIEVLVTGRSLAEFATPRFPHASGFQGLGLGIVATAFPVHWFVMLLGPYEVAARLPLLLYLPVLLATLFELIEFGKTRLLRPSEEVALVLATCSFGAALALNASYDAFTFDIAAPGATDTLAVIAMAASILYLWRQETTWLLGAAVLGIFSRPTELLALVLLALAVLVVPRATGAGWLARVAMAVAACIAARFLYESVFIPWASGELTPGHMTESLPQRLQYLTFSDVRRVLFLVVPSGIVASAALFAYRRQDPWTRSLSIFCVGYFAFFYVLAFVNLHHFAPVMILPVVVFWRVVIDGRFRLAAPIATVGAVAALLLAIPADTGVYRSARDIGRRTAWLVGAYAESYQGYREAWGAIPGLMALFPGYEPSGAPMPHDAILYYASRFSPSVMKADYVGQSAAAEPPPGFLHVATEGTVSVFVRDTLTWHRDRANMPELRHASWVYRIPQETLHRHVGAPQGNYDLNLGSLPGVWRLFQ